MEGLDHAMCVHGIDVYPHKWFPLSIDQNESWAEVGGSLSLFLFILVGKVFNKMVVKAKELNLVEGITVGFDGVELSHLQFANDTLLFSPNNKDCLLNFRHLVDYFLVMSGLYINYGKSALIPFRCDEAWVQDIKVQLRCSVAWLLIRQLGIPLGANPKRMSTWHSFLNKIQKRLTMWKAKFLSRAGRLVLIKSVLNNLPLYYSSLFKIPKLVVRKIISMQRNFFWYSSNYQKGIPLVAWEAIQKPKECGDLGVGDLIVKNSALLFKWWWHFNDHCDTL